MAHMVTLGVAIGMVDPQRKSQRHPRHDQAAILLSLSHHHNKGAKNICPSSPLLSILNMLSPLSVRSKVPVRFSPFFISCNRRFCSLWCDDWGSQTHLARHHHRTQLIQVQSFPSPYDLQFWNPFLR